MKSSLTFFYLSLFLVVTSVCRYDADVVKRTNSGFNAELKLVAPSLETFEPDPANLNVEVKCLTKSIVRVRITDSEKARWEVPDVVIANPQTEFRYDESVFEISHTSHPFGVKISDKSTHAVLFDSVGNGADSDNIVFQEHFMKVQNYFGELADGPYIYGLGERQAPFLLETDSHKYTLWNNDAHRWPEDAPLYGSHAMYMHVDRDKEQAHGVFLLNSNAMDVYLHKTFIQYKVIGGIFEFYVMAGPSAEQVAQQYQFLIGKPVMVPYWGFGYHQCKWGYRTLAETKEVVKQYKEHNIPLETMWNDIDYMDEYKDFTWDPVRFPEPEVKDFIDELHANGQHYMCIVDPGIAINSTQESYTTGVQLDVFVKNGTGPGYMANKVWPGWTVFPDFSKPETTPYWINELRQFEKNGAIDGFWIDMNEIAARCDCQCGEIPPWPANAFNPDEPPYRPGDKSLCAHGTTLTGSTHNGPFYDTRNLYSFYEMKATRKAVDVVLPGERSLIISRSTFPGSGRYGSHWTGDNTSNYRNLYLSIGGLLNFNLFGIPFVGADVCGFDKNTTAELCGRWIQLGSLYPFTRNHNNNHMIPQELYRFGEEIAQTARTAIGLKYVLLPYYYSQFYEIHLNGGTAIRPLFWDNLGDKTALTRDQQFLIGSGLMAAPVLDQGNSTVEVYFTKGMWYSFDSYTLIANNENIGGWLTANAALSDPIPLFIRGGNVIPTHTEPRMTTKELLDTGYSLLVALDYEGKASGFMYVDSGDGSTHETYTRIQFRASTHWFAGSLQGFVEENYFGGSDNASISDVTVLGVKRRPMTVVIDGSRHDFSYSRSNEVLSIHRITSVSAGKDFLVTWEGLSPGNDILFLFFFGSLLAVAGTILFMRRASLLKMCRKNRRGRYRQGLESE